MRKRRIERHYMIAFLSREDRIKGVELMKEDGLVRALDCGGVVGIVASESQLKKLTKAGVRWEHVSNGRKTAVGGKDR